MPALTTDYEKLMWNLLFSSQCQYEIDIEKYCKHNERPEFREKVRSALKRGQRAIIEDRVIHYEDSIIWKLELESID